MSPTQTEKVHGSPEEFEEIDKRLSLHLSRIEELIDIPLLNEREKKAVLYELQRNLGDCIDSEGKAVFVPGDIMQDVWDSTARITQNHEWLSSGVFNEKQMAANKLYAAGIFQALSQREADGKQADASRVYSMYFSSSDQPIDFTGGYDSSLELFALTRRSEVGRKLSADIVAGLIYDGTFNDIAPDLEKAWLSQRAVEGQLNMLATVDYLLRAAENEIYPTDRMQAALYSMEESVANNDGIPVFVARVAAKFIQDKIDRSSTEFVYLDGLPPEEAEGLTVRDREYREQSEAEQRLLHEEFSDFPDDVHLYRIATDACTEMDRGDFLKLITTKGDTANLSKPDARGSIDIGVGDIELLKQAHSGSILDTIELESGIDMRMFSLNTQIRFFRFMAEAQPEAYGRLTSVLHSATEGCRAVLAEAFLATEFGDDYGDSILSIAENATPEQSAEIFETINNFRNSSQKIARWYESYDSEFSKAIELAMNERLSDALTAMEVLVRDGRLDVDTSPGRHSDNYESDGRFVMKLHSVEEGLEIIGSLEKSLRLISGIVTAGDVKVYNAVEDNSQFNMYRFSSEELGDALLYIRPEGAKGYDRQLEYGNRSGVEASMSFIVNPTNPHKLDIYKDPQGVSIRFDREGRMTDESPFAEDRDPTRQNGSISLDISSLMGDGRHMPVKIGRFIAAGNILRAAKTGGEESLHHNNNHFDQSLYGTAGGFARLAVYTAHMAEAMIAIQQSGSHSSPYPSIPAGNKLTS